MKKLTIIIVGLALTFASCSNESINPQFEDTQTSNCDPSEIGCNPDDKGDVSSNK